MTENDIKDYLEKLKQIEQQLSSDDDVQDFDFLKDVDKVLSGLNSDLAQQMGQPTNSTTTVNSNTTTVTQGVMVKVKKLDPNAVIPSYSKVGDAGMDLTITDIKENTTFSISYGFGIAMEIPKGYVGLVFPRSSVRNQELILSNCVGVIDSGYRGELQATFKKTQGLDSVSYNVGERGAQIIILPYPQVFMTEVPELSNSERGEGGFGSTGK
jgi:dUTP pyrophosphatase